jgi:hypothetical protein
MPETIEETLSRLRREQWQPIRDEHQSVHRGLGMELSDEDHEAIHDSSRPVHERATRLMQHIAHGHTREDYGWGGDLGGSGLGIHWTTDANVAHHFSKIDASHRVKYDEDADPRHGHNADGFPRQRPETRVVLHAHFPEHEHVAHEENDQDGAFGWDVRNQLQHTENGGGVPGGYEREVPIKRGKPVRVHAISWGLASHRTDDPAPHDQETARYDFPETQHHQASFHRWLTDGSDALAPRQAVTDHWPPYLTERHDPEYGDVPVNTSRHNVRGPVGTEEQAHAAGWVGPYFHGTSSRRAADIRRGGFRQPRVHNQDMRLPGDSEEVDFGHTHRTYFAHTHDDAMSFARAHHGDDAAVVTAYLHPDHVETESGGGFMPSTQVRDAAKVMAIQPASKQERGQHEAVEHAAVRRGPVDMSKYFRGSVDEPHEIPGLFSGNRGVALDEHTWRKMPTEQVPLDGLHATQSRVFHKHLDRYRKGNDVVSDGGDLPWVINHEGRNWVLDGHHRVVDAVDRGQTHIEAHVMRPRFGEHEAARFLPHERIFGPTHGLDHRLWDGDHLKHDVSSWVMDTLDGFWRPVYGPSWRAWSRVYFAGSEASEWTSETREGNNDFDCLIGLDFARIREDLGGLFTMMTDEQIVGGFNKQLTTLLWPRTDAVMIPVEGNLVGPMSATFFCNAQAWDIREIKPYAAYCISTDRWAVRPPHLPDWSIKDFPPAFVKEARAVEAYVRAVLALPEPMRAQQADALWRHLHSDRSRAFSAQGEGWYDPGNALEKYLDQSKGTKGASLWETLAEAHFEAQAHPEELLAPSDWSNTPPVNS